MTELELSLTTIPFTPETGEEVFQNFAAQTGVRVNVTTLPWGTAWNDLVRVGIHTRGLDVSEIGSTWLSDFVGMNSLRPFSMEQIEMVGGPGRYWQTAWENGRVAGDPQIWAIPWLVDTRLLYYRRDLLAQAGVDEAEAFRSQAALKDTLGRLRAAGVDSPWVIPTRKTRMTLHNSTSWVWAAGGDFVTPNGKKILFAQPAALEGFCRYFELAEFLAPQARDLDDTQSDALFTTGSSAVTISGPWVYYLAVQAGIDVGVAPVPGVPFVGGSSLVVWKHSYKAAAALELIRYLSSPAVAARFRSGIGMLPARQDALQSLPDAGAPIYSTMAGQLKSGRSFRHVPLWGMIEERLDAALALIWKEIFASPQADICPVVERNINNLATRLELILNG